MEQANNIKQHFLQGVMFNISQSLYNNSEANHKRHFIKIPFINKVMEFIDLHSIFKDNLLISYIPNYFNNSKTPFICYKYNKPIRSTLFNFNKIVCLFVCLFVGLFVCLFVCLVLKDASTLVGH